MRIDTEQLPIFWRQLGSLLRGGLGLPEALRALGRDAERPRAAADCDGIARAVDDGRPLSAALAGVDGIDPASRAVVAAGERTGDLPGALALLAEHADRAHRLAARFRLAVAYPLLLLGFCALVSWGAHGSSEWLVQVGDGLGAPVSDAKLLLRDATLVLVNAAFLVALALAAGALLVRRFPGRLPRIESLLDGLQLRLPVWRGPYRAAVLARFARVLATLLRAGVPLDAALDVAAPASGSARLARDGAAAARAVREGGSAAEALSGSALAGTALWAFQVAERRGDLTETAAGLADYYDEAASLGGETALTLFEPLAIATVGLFVAAVVLAIFAPVPGIYGSTP